VAAHANIRATVATRETDYLDKVRPISQGRRGFPRRYVFVRDKQRARVAQHAVHVKVRRHHRPHSRIAAGAAQPALSTDAQKRAVEAAGNRLIDFTHHGAEKDYRNTAPLRRYVLGVEHRRPLGHELPARPFAIDVPDLGRPPARDDRRLDAG
jgi:hypothetical protein